MNAITETNTNTAVAMQGGYDPFAAYGAEAAQGGTFLKFNKGEWQKGQNSDEVPLATLLVANMDELSIGWVRWEDGKPAERRMNLLVSGVRPDARADLGYDDQTQWEVDKEGKPQDPWNFTNELPVADPETGEQLVFSASSKGSIGCIGNLCKIYAKGRQSNPGLVPVLELDRTSYMHKEHGKLYVPVLNIVEWIENDGAPRAVASNEDAPAANAPASQAETPAAKETTGAKTRF